MSATMEIFRDNKSQIRTRFVSDNGNFKSDTCDAIYATVGDAFSGIKTRSKELGIKVDAYLANSF